MSSADFTGRFVCVRCGAATDTSEPWTGCQACARAGVNAQVLPEYRAVDGEIHARNDAPGVFRYARRLPVPAGIEPISLGEGGTPLVDADKLAHEIQVGRLFFKDETRNPTWSYKDRLAAVAVTDAHRRGAETIALATTGNHGAAAAAYAAAAGIDCVALTLTSVPTTMKVLMQSYGAQVLALNTPADRWRLLDEAVTRLGWVPVSGFCNPPIGSNPYGVDGYKTIAFEIAEQVGEVDVVVVPAAYADGLAGIQRGFKDLVESGVITRSPRMVSVDPFGAYREALQVPDAGVLPQVATGGTVSFSIGTSVATHQGLAAINETAGHAVAVPDDETTMSAQRRIAESTGLFLEASSATCLPAVEQLWLSGLVGADDTVVCIATSTGLKDVGAAAERSQPVPVIEPELSELMAALAR